MNEGYVFVMGSCCICGNVTWFNANRVPSLRGRYTAEGFVPSLDGLRNPLCEPCARQLFAELKAKGENPPPIHRDAYSPMPEGELE